MKARLSLAAASLAAIATSAPAEAAHKIKVTLHSYTYEIVEFFDHEVVEGDPAIYVDGHFMFVFDPSKNFGPTSEGVVRSSILASYGIGKFNYGAPWDEGGEDDVVYHTVKHDFPTVITYDAENRVLYFDDGLPRLPDWPWCQQHCGSISDFVPEEGSYRDYGDDSWNIANGPANMDYGHIYTVEAVPEPSTWMLMLGGFGAIGGVMRSRRRKVAASYG